MCWLCLEGQGSTQPTHNAVSGSVVVHTALIMHTAGAHSQVPQLISFGPNRQSQMHGKGFQLGEKRAPVNSAISRPS